MILIDAKGRCLDPDSRKPIKGNETRAAIDHLIGHVGSAHVLLFLHGGLNDPGSAVGRAQDKERMNAIFSAGFYPIYIGWDANLWTSYRDHLYPIRRGVSEPFWGVGTMPLVLFGDAVGGVGDAPMDWYHQVFETDWRRLQFSGSPWNNREAMDPPRLLNPEPQLVNREYRELRQLLSSSPERAIKISLGHFSSDSGRNSLGSVTYFAFLPLRIGSSPLVGSGGQEAWEGMRRRIQSLFFPPDRFDLRPEQSDVRLGRLSNDAFEDRVRGAVLPHDDGALPIFLRRLSESQQLRSNQITLVAHSMGTIVACEMLTRYHRIKYDNIVFMAAACSLNEFDRAVVPYLQESPGTLFYNLCLHPQHDIDEGFGGNRDLVAERGSLLEWIDNFYSTPEHFMDRMLGKWDNVVQAVHIIPDDIRGRLTIKAFGVNPRQKFSKTFVEDEYVSQKESGPQAHGEFTNWPYWRKWFWDYERTPVCDSKG